MVRSIGSGYLPGALFYYLLADRQAQTRTLAQRLGGKERLEHPICLGRQALACIFKSYNGRIAIKAGVDRQGAAIGHGLYGIVDQIKNDR